MRSTVKNITATALAACLGAVCCFQFFSSSEEHRELRLPASSLLRAIDSHDYGPPIENQGNGSRVWAIRSVAENAPLGQELAWAAQYVLDVPDIVLRSLAETEAPQAELERPTPAGSGAPHLLAPLLDLDGSDHPGLMAALPFDFTEAIDSRGRPVRWQMSENLLAGFSRLRPNHFSREPVSAAEAAPPPALPRSARLSYYRGLVENFSRRYNLNTSLVMAIIHSESDFSPALVSSKSAMGLMQLLPSTASDEVHRFLYGRRGQIGFEDLRNPEINIRYGTAYLHILLNRYFPNVRNRDVREVCAIASYNLGPNRFLRLYGPTNEQAVEKINGMSEDEFYEDLTRRLPARETRFFVEKVRRMKKHYSSLP